MATTNTATKYGIGEALAEFARKDKKAVVKFCRRIMWIRRIGGAAREDKEKKGEAATGPSDETLTYFHLSLVLDTVSLVARRRSSTRPCVSEQRTVRRRRL
ncbi:hypothetical protein V7S43_007591 [Phytophthora oleae]|uniref:Uncharacterized protein n=1 Tax=Phytophthora oleae TaxID=2107226 RepID=A0ABD3FKD2_9STRA